MYMYFMYKDDVTFTIHHLQEYEYLKGKNPRSIFSISVFKLCNYTREN